MRLGKYYKSSTDKQLESVVLQMNDSLRLQERTIKDAGESKSSKCSIALDAAFMEPYVFAESTNLWLGPPMAVEPKEFSKRGILSKSNTEKLTPIDSPDNLYTTDGKLLYADVLSLYSRGVARSKAYFERFHVNGAMNVTTRSRKEADLSKPKVTDEKMREEVELSACLDSSILKASKIYTVARIKQELALLNEELTAEDLDMVVVEGKKNKLCLALALVKAREALRSLEGNEVDWKKKVQQRAKDRYEGQQKNARDVIAEEAEHSFFSFEGTEARNSLDLGAKKIKFILGDDRGNDEEDVESALLRRESTWDRAKIDLMKHLLGLLELE